MDPVCGDLPSCDAVDVQHRLLIFSGVTLPYEVMPATLQRIADLKPLTQGIKLLKAASLGHPAGEVWIFVTVLILEINC